MGDAHLVKPGLAGERDAELAEARLHALIAAVELRVAVQAAVDGLGELRGGEAWAGRRGAGAGEERLEDGGGAGRVG